nr:MAG TPA: CotJB protein [Caudoviricetes sp.]
MRLGENNVKTILKNLSTQDIKLYIDTHLNCARVIKVYEIDDEYTFIVMF